MKEMVVREIDDRVANPAMPDFSILADAETELNENTLSTVDCVVTANHSCPDWNFITEHVCVLVDVWNVVPGIEMSKAEVFRQ